MMGSAQKSLRFWKMRRIQHDFDTDRLSKRDRSRRMDPIQAFVDLQSDSPKKRAILTNFQKIEKMYPST